MGQIFTGHARFWGASSLETADFGRTSSLEEADFGSTYSLETAAFGANWLKAQPHLRQLNWKHRCTGHSSIGVADATETAEMRAPLALLNLGHIGGVQPH